MSRETSPRSPSIRNGSFSIDNHILLTGFEPFAGARFNPSQQAAEALHGAVIGALRIRSMVLPCRFGEAAAVLGRAMGRHRPRVVICLGLAARRRAITPEAVARNWVDARLPDNAGCRPRRQPVRPGGPAAHLSGLPVVEIAAAIRAAGLPARVSRSAGTFVCNEVFYRLMDELRKQPGVRGGFIHVPPLSSDGRNSAGLGLAGLVRGIRIAIEATVGDRR